MFIFTYIYIYISIYLSIYLSISLSLYVYFQVYTHVACTYVWMFLHGYLNAANKKVRYEYQSRIFQKLQHAYKDRLPL